MKRGTPPQPRSDCIIWDGYIMSNGYGLTGKRGNERYAHRVAVNAPVGMEVDHLCRIRSCVNPEHLEIVTPRENRRRQNWWVTECPQGHVYDASNTYLAPDGGRRCRTCALITIRKWRACHPDRVQEYRRRAQAKRKAGV